MRDKTDTPSPQPHVVGAWPIETDDQVEALARECDWNNRRFMTPADYSIWCERMRKFVRLASCPSDLRVGGDLPSPEDIDALIEELLDAQQDVNLAANETMSQSLCDASALIDKVEGTLRRIRAALSAEVRADD